MKHLAPKTCTRIARGMVKCPVPQRLLIFHQTGFDTAPRMSLFSPPLLRYIRFTDHGLVSSERNRAQSNEATGWPARYNRFCKIWVPDSTGRGWVSTPQKNKTGLIERMAPAQTGS